MIGISKAGVLLCATVAFLLGAAIDQVAHAGESKKCVPSSLADGRPIYLDPYRGKVLYIDFWASWCGPCKLSFPVMDELQKEFGRDGFQIIAISVDKDRKDAEKFVDRLPSSFLRGFDPSGQCPQVFNVETMPTSYIFGKDGRLLHTHHGFRPGDKGKIRKLIRQAVSERSAGG